MDINHFQFSLFIDFFCKSKLIPQILKKMYSCLYGEGGFNNEKQLFSFYRFIETFIQLIYPVFVDC